MPSLDPARLRARLSSADLAALSRLRRGDGVEPPLHDRLPGLRHAGFVDDDGLHPLAAAIVDVVCDAQLVLDVEVSGPTGLSGQGAAIAGDVACLLQAWPGDAESEYAMTSPGLVVPGLALAAGLAPAPADPGRLPLEVLFRHVDGALAALAQAPSGGWERVRSAAADVVRSDLGDDGSRLVDLLADLRRCVRFTASGPGRTPRGFVLLDAGSLGYWTRSVPAEPLTAEALTQPDLRVVLDPVTPKQVWSALVGLLDG